MAHFAAMVTALPALGLADHAGMHPRHTPRSSSTQPSPTPPSPPGNCLGRWVGTGRNAGDPPWSIDMVVTAERAARCGTIEYPSLQCGGYLVDCQRVGDRVTWREVYTHNPGTCAPAGTVQGRCQGATMAWTWIGDTVVHTRLTRVP